jgi:hypothetical protein
VERARIIRAYWINGTQSWPILVKPREWVLRRVPDNTVQSASYPHWGYLEGNALRVTPPSVNDGVVRVTYQQIPLMTEDSDENPIKLTNEAVISFATSWVYKSLAMREDSLFWEQNGERALYDAVNADTDNSVIDFGMDMQGVDNTPFIEAWQDPFAGHSRSW